MGRIEILDKLADKFRMMPKSEEDVVYILSKIRKILESQNYPDAFSVLNFYCNLCLHIRITKAPKVVIEKLKEVASGTSYSNSLVGFSDFHDQLRKFIKEHELPNFYTKSTPEDRKLFNNKILDVWSDTPIKLEYIKEYRVTLKKTSSGSPEISFDPVE